MTVIELEQGSQTWLDWRMNRRMASETPAVTRRSPYQNWEGLRNVKRGQQTKQTAAMAHGHANEHAVRLWAASETGMLFVPVCVEDGDYAASLDGLEGRAIVEIKAPYKGKQSDTWKLAEQGLIRPDYDDQVIHQLAVSGADVCYFTVYDAESKRGIILERRFDADLWAKLQKQWDEFWTWHMTDDPDPAKNVRTDSDWAQFAAIYTAAKRQADHFAKLADMARADLIGLAGDESAEGYGVKVSRFEKAGSVDYKKALATIDPSADLSMFRKAGTTETRVTIN